MTADFILEDDFVRVVGGYLSVDENIRLAENLFIGEGRAHLSATQLNMEPHDDGEPFVRLSSRRLTGVGAVNTNVLSCDSFQAQTGEVTQLDLGKRNHFREGPRSTASGVLRLLNNDELSTIEIIGGSGSIHFRRNTIAGADGSMIYVYTGRPAEDPEPDTGLHRVGPDISIAEPDVVGPLSRDAVVEQRRPEIFPGKPDGGVGPGPMPLQFLKQTVAAEAESHDGAIRSVGRFSKSPSFKGVASAADRTEALSVADIVEAVSAADRMESIAESILDSLPLTPLISHSPQLPDWGLAYHPAQRMVFQGDGKPALTVDLHGKVGVAMDDPQHELHVNGTIAATEPLQVLADERCMKKDPIPIDDALDKILRLVGVSYEWDPEALPQTELPDGRRYGFVAQAVQDVVPEAVSHSDGDAYSVAAGALVPVLVEAMKQQQATIDDMNSRLQGLEAER